MASAFLWSAIVPFHNESSYLPDCIASLFRQRESCRLILVDNGSTDGSGDVARAVCEQLGIDALHLFEARPGKVSALQHGLAHVGSPFVATCDADTIYPADYLWTATALLSKNKAAAAIAATAPEKASKLRIKAAGLRLEFTAALLRQQCLNGGAGQVFRTAALRECGGFDPDIWNWVLEDHEVMARIAKLGAIIYHRDFVCFTSQRPRGLGVREWSLAKQIRYHLSCKANREAFFHTHLAPHLEQRGLSSERLRQPDPAPQTLWMPQ